MTRIYKPINPRGKIHQKYTPEAIEEALRTTNEECPFARAKKKHEIPIKMLCRRAKNPNIKSQGGQTALNEEIEIRDVPSQVRVLGRVVRHYSDLAESEY